MNTNVIAGSKIFTYNQIGAGAGVVVCMMVGRTVIVGCYRVGGWVGRLPPLLWESYYISTRTIQPATPTKPGQELTGNDEDVVNISGMPRQMAKGMRRAVCQIRQRDFKSTPSLLFLGMEGLRTSSQCKGEEEVCLIVPQIPSTILCYVRFCFQYPAHDIITERLQNLTSACRVSVLLFRLSVCLRYNLHFRFSDKIFNKYPSGVLHSLDGMLAVQLVSLSLSVYLSALCDALGLCAINFMMMPEFIVFGI